MAPLIEELTPAPDPVRCCEQLDGLPYRLFLDSAAPGARLGPLLVRDGRPGGGRAQPRRQTDVEGGQTALPASDALSCLRALLAPHRAEPVDGLPPFQGGAAGYLGYDWGLTLERLPAPRFDDLALDDVVIGLYDWVLAWDHVAQQGVADLHRDSGTGRIAARARARRRARPR